MNKKKEVVKKIEAKRKKQKTAKERNENDDERINLHADVASSVCRGSQ